MQPAMQPVQLRVPPHLHPGQEMQFQLHPGGPLLKVVIPIGVLPGQDFVVQVPMAPAPPAPTESVPMGMPVDTARPLPPAKRYAECAICFEPLNGAPVGVFLDAAGKRVSNHYYNLEAARSWLATGNGMDPLTRSPISSVKPVPDVRNDPDGWFSVVDMNGDGRLSRAEAIEAIKAQYPVDVAALDAAVTDPNNWMWQQWDADRSGYLERRELLAKDGLVASVRDMFAAKPRGGIPDMRSNKQAWYEYFDEDRSGSLEQEEVVRALIKTLHLSSDQARVAEMRNTVQAIWPVFDSDGSGSIERGEFLAPGDGLADTIIATMG